ncbi:MAG TPA: phosphoribosyltransferase family protein [Cyclobacteriaceae bacterium]|jgi:ComF family protein|nr:ComF family protein [Cytophagales bacterium]HMR55739.1 phosphoribosyltransferase family protein [Cyclobacteriaceae bacterium]HNT50235.1 phosphoribosyltransferase family protein [Cyclobacteriaceae bacterium]HRE65296.1 phosphoribosyltransferase family protein [Cyclobacteriaceae bacterium]HRF35634.1 phosphoribosyltransferase family protein [Cyclobacteriaceae bacterium]
MGSKQIKSNVAQQTLSLLRDFVSLVYPNYCMGCSNTLYRGEEILCTYCISNLPRTNYIYNYQNPVMLRLQGRLRLKYGLAFLKFRKHGLVQRLLHQLKYNNHPEVGEVLGRVFGKEMFENGYANEFDVIIPVPLHASRRRARGYNQSAWIAKGLGVSLEIPWDESISTRKVSTKTQTRKTKTQRWHNVEHVFDIKNEDRIRDKRILLVDDVMTTGATLEACGTCLLQAGCKELSVVCLAEA